jgi:hypothetical protein
MSLADVLALAGKGVPGLDAAVKTGEAFSECAAFKGFSTNHGLYTVGIIYNRVRDVKVYRVSLIVGDYYVFSGERSH